MKGCYELTTFILTLLTTLETQIEGIGNETRSTNHHHDVSVILKKVCGSLSPNVLNAVQDACHLLPVYIITKPSALHHTWK